MDHFNFIEDISSMNTAYTNLKFWLVDDYTIYNNKINKRALTSSAKDMVNEILPYTLYFRNLDTKSICKYIDKNYSKYPLHLRNIFKDFLISNKKYAIA